MKDTLVFCEYSQTIRQNPQNYLVASWNNHYWLFNPDLSVNRKLAHKVVENLFEYENKYSKENLLKELKITN